MTCPIDSDRLLDFAVGELPPADARAVEIHLAACSICRSELEFHRRLVTDLRSLPAPRVPADLEDVLVRAGIQARREVVQAQRTVAPSRRLDWVGLACALAGVAIVVVLVCLLAPGGPFSGGSVEEVVYGEPGRGTTLLNDALQFAENVRQAWRLLADVVEWLAPVGRAAQAAMLALGTLRWSIGLFSVAAALLVLWRLTRSGSNDRLGAARMRSGR